VETIFIWEPAKAARNLRAHGISFETAREVFADPFIVTSQDITDRHEQRWHAIGMTGTLVLLLVVFVERAAPDIEIIRIISARKANQYEQNIYQEQFS
jgi:uncharacterized DUF497 family protein